MSTLSRERDGYASLSGPERLQSVSTLDVARAEQQRAVLVAVEFTGERRKLSSAANLARQSATISASADDAIGPDAAQRVSITSLSLDFDAGLAEFQELARSAGASTSPVISGLLLQGPLLTLGIPFIVAGALKSAYDLVLWRLFRKVPISSSRR